VVGCKVVGRGSRRGCDFKRDERIRGCGSHAASLENSDCDGGLQAREAGVRRFRNDKACRNGRRGKTSGRRSLSLLASQNSLIENRFLGRDSCFQRVLSRLVISRWACLPSLFGDGQVSEKPVIHSSGSGQVGVTTYRLNESYEVQHSRIVCPECLSRESKLDRDAPPLLPTPHKSCDARYVVR
jgi:hypothetical protein